MLVSGWEKMKNLAFLSLDIKAQGDTELHTREGINISSTPISDDGGARGEHATLWLVRALMEVAQTAR
jgi:hypothetical protein